MILTVQYNSVFMTENRSIRIVLTNVESLVKYAKVLMSIFAAFNVHVTLLHAKPAKSVSEAKEFFNEAVNILDKILWNTQTSFNHQLVCQGPQGTESNKTVQSVKQLQQLLEHLQPLAATYNPQLLQFINLKALLTLNNEYFNGALNFADASEDTFFTLAYAGFSYYTRERRTYDLPSNKGMTYADLEPVEIENAVKYDKEKVQLLLQYRNDFGQGVKQQKNLGSYNER